MTRGGVKREMMRKNTTLLLGLFLLLTLPPLFVEVAHAEDEAEVSLYDIPLKLGEALGISTFAGGLLATVILLLIIMLPSGMLIRGKHAVLFMVIEGNALYGFCVAVAWLPAWSLLILVFILALLFAKKWGDLIP